MQRRRPESAAEQPGEQGRGGARAGAPGTPRPSLVGFARGLEFSGEQEGPSQGTKECVGLIR